MNTPVHPIIALCIATYKRPALLLNCLNAVATLEIPEKHRLFVLVADNDHEATARETVAHLNIANADHVTYCVESERGIASARNRLLREALHVDADLIAFIDDDEFPQSDWLFNLFRGLSRYDADVVTGPVIGLTEDGNAVSSTAGKYQTGQQPRKVATGNVLFKKKLIKEDGLTFDLRLNFCGGEDMDFFEKSSRQGNTHVWVEDGIVFETITKERTTKKYLFYRHFTGGINNVVRYRLHNGWLKSWSRFLLKITGKTIGAMLAFTAFLITFNDKKLDSSIAKFASGLGYLSGLLNIIVERYR